jgi:hypothetical protein
MSLFLIVQQMFITDFVPDYEGKAVPCLSTASWGAMEVKPHGSEVVIFTLWLM